MKTSHIFGINLNGAAKNVVFTIINILFRDLEKNNITEIHEDAFLPLNNLKDL